MRVKDFALTVAIGVLTIFVTFYGINTVWPSNNYEDFCSYEKTARIYENQTQCEDAEGRWTPQQIECIKAPCPQGYCDTYFECSQQYEDAQTARARNVFLVALPLGILIIALGAFAFGLEPVGAGLMLGGIGTLIYGSGAYWRYTENWARFLMSLVGLVILVWATYWFNRKGKKR